MHRLSTARWALLVVGLVLSLTPPLAAAETRGMVKTVTAGQNELALTDTVDRLWTFHLLKGCKVYLNQKEVGLADLLPGDMAVVVYEIQDTHRMAREIRCTRQ